jgi:hypothetical protein
MEQQWNDNERVKLKDSEKTSSSATLSTTNPTQTWIRTWASMVRSKQLPVLRHSHLVLLFLGPNTLNLQSSLKSEHVESISEN